MTGTPQPLAGVFDRAAATYDAVGIDYFSVFGDWLVRDAQVRARDRVLDVVLAGMALFFLPDPAAAVRSWAAALRPGGRLAVSTFAGEEPRWRPVGEIFGPFLAGPDPRPSRSAADRPWETSAGLKALLGDAGLSGVRHVVRRHVAVFPDPLTWLRWTWSHGQRAAWERIPEDRREAAGAALLDALRPLAEPDGSLRLRVDVRCTTARRTVHPPAVEASSLGTAKQRRIGSDS